MGFGPVSVTHGLVTHMEVKYTQLCAVCYPAAQYIKRFLTIFLQTFFFILPM